MGEGDILLEETFYPLSNKTVTYKVKLTEKQLILNRINGCSTRTEILDLNDIIGCQCTRRKRRADEICICHPTSNKKVQQVNNSRPVENGEKYDISAYLHIYSYVIRNFLIKSGQKRERFTITLRFRSSNNYEENMKEAQKWKAVLKRLINPRIHSTISSRVLSRRASEIDGNQGETRVLVVLNPKSGVGKSREIFHHSVVPLLSEADLDYDLHVTTAQNDARSFIRKADITKWKKGIIVIGGDGVLFEVINGIMDREDWKESLQKVTFGIIPGGSGNGLAKSLCFFNKEPYDENPVLVSTLNIIKGSSAPLDLVRVETQSEILYSFLSVGWGLLADIDIESERLRAIGGQRFTVWSIVRLIGLRTYPGRLSFLRIPEDRLEEVLNRKSYMQLLPPEEYGDSYDEESIDSFDVTAEVGAGIKQADKSDRNRKLSFYSIMSNRSDYMSVGNSSFQSLPEVMPTNKKLAHGPTSVLPPLHHTIPKNWEIYQGDFVMVHAAYQSHIGEDVLFAPNARPKDGIIWLLVVKAGITRAGLLQFLLSLADGSHINVPNVEMIPVIAFRLEPFSAGSYIVIDGEVIEHGSLQAEIFPGLISTFSRQKNGHV